MAKSIPIERYNVESNCPECNSQRTQRDNKRGELICLECGIVIEEGFVDGGKEWRAFNSEEEKNRARCGEPLTLFLHDKGLSTLIGSQIMKEPIQNKRAKQIKKTNARSFTSKERSMMKILAIFNKSAGLLGITRNLKNDSVKVLRKYYLKNGAKGLTLENLVAIIIYISSRKSRNQLSINELADKLGLDESNLKRTFFKILDKLKLIHEPKDPKILLEKYLLLTNREDCRIQALKIHNQYSRSIMNLSGHNPIGITGAIIYLSAYKSGNTITQKILSKKLKISITTLQDNIKTLVNLLNIDVNDFRNAISIRQRANRSKKIEGTDGTKIITVNMTEMQYVALANMVRERFFMSKSEAIRYSIRNYIMKALENNEIQGNHEWEGEKDIITVNLPSIFVDYMDSMIGKRIPNRSEGVRRAIDEMIQNESKMQKKLYESFK